MADWNQPVITSLNTDVLSILKARDLDTARLFKDNPANPVDGMIRIVRAADNNADRGVRFKVQEYDGAVWRDRPLGVEGGGTGKKTIAAARSSLGLGTMSSQNSDAVNISAGNIAAAAITGTLNKALIPGLPASRIISGSFKASRIPGLDASKLITGLISNDRLPALTADDIPTLSKDLIADSFELTALAKVTKTLSADLSDFRYIMITGGDNSSTGRGLGSTMIPYSIIPVSDGVVDQYLYGISRSRLYRINQSNGAIVQDIAAITSIIPSLGETAGKLYGYKSSGLHLIDIATGTTVLVGGKTFHPNKLHLALGSVDGVLYLTQYQSGNSPSDSDLYSVNLITGAATIHRNNYKSGNDRIESLGGLNGILYGVSVGKRLFSNIQPGGNIVNVGALGVRILGLAGVGRTLYGINATGGNSLLYSINTSSGAATFLGMNAVEIKSLAGLDAGVADSARIHIIPSKRVDIWRPTNTTNELGFYSDQPTTIVKVIGFI